MTIRKTSGPRMLLLLAHTEKTEKTVKTFTAVSRYVGSVTLNWPATHFSIHSPVKYNFFFRALVFMMFLLFSEQISSPIPIIFLPALRCLQFLCLPLWGSSDAWWSHQRLRTWLRTFCRSTSRLHRWYTGCTVTLSFILAMKCKSFPRKIDWLNA
jgi:hypothetical protein